MTRRVTYPIPGQYYDLATHGEPPEGVHWSTSDWPVHDVSRENSAPENVLIWCPVTERWNSESIDSARLRAQSTSGAPFQWMFQPPAPPAPTPAPAVEEPPFPLSREEIGDGLTLEEVTVHALRIGGEFESWWWNQGVHPRLDDGYSHEVLERRWRAAGRPGAEKTTCEEFRDASPENRRMLEEEERKLAAEEAQLSASAEVPWRVFGDGKVSGGLERGRPGDNNYSVCTLWHGASLVADLISDANAHHAEREAREEAEFNAEKYRAKAEAYGSIVHGCLPALEAAGHKVTEKANIAAAVRSLVRERDELRLQKQAVQAEFDTLSAKLANKSPRVRIFGDIGLERCKQDQKWGQAERGDAVFCAILGEEFGEVCQAVLQEKPIADVREELIQTAAVAVQWVEILDRRATSREGR